MSFPLQAPKGQAANEQVRSFLPVLRDVFSQALRPGSSVSSCGSIHTRTPSSQEPREPFSESLVFHQTSDPGLQCSLRGLQDTGQLGLWSLACLVPARSPPGLCTGCGHTARPRVLPQGPPFVERSWKVKEEAKVSVAPGLACPCLPKAAPAPLFWAGCPNPRPSLLEQPCMLWAGWARGAQRLRQAGLA